MATIHHRPSVTLQVTLTLTESEARALEAIAGYQASDVLAAFYQACGRSYLEPHEAGFRSLLDCCGKQLGPALKRVDEARAVFEGRKTVVQP